MSKKLYVAVKKDGEPVLWSIRETKEDVYVAMQENNTIEYTVKETTLGAVTEAPEEINIKPVSLRDFSCLEATVTEYIEFVQSEDYHEDSDHDHYIFEEAVTAFYGKDVFDKINKIT